MQRVCVWNERRTKTHIQSTSKEHRGVALRGKSWGYKHRKYADAACVWRPWSVNGGQRTSWSWALREPGVWLMTGCRRVPTNGVVDIMTDKKWRNHLLKFRFVFFVSVIVFFCLLFFCCFLLVCLFVSPRFCFSAYMMQLRPPANALLSCCMFAFAQENGKTTCWTHCLYLFAFFRWWM